MCYLTHPPDPLTPTIGVQWCVLLSRSAIGAVGVVIAARIGAAAAVALLSPAALPDQRLLCRRCRRSSPPLSPPTAIGASSASSTPLGAGSVAGDAIPGIDDGTPPISDDQLPPPLSPPPLPSPTTSCAPNPTLLLCRPVVRHPLAAPPLSSSRPPPARLTPPSLSPPPPLVVLSAARPPRGNIATASSLRPPPPSSRSLRAVHCRLLHAISARTLPPPC